MPAHKRDERVLYLPDRTVNQLLQLTTVTVTLVRLQLSNSLNFDLGLRDRVLAVVHVIIRTRIRQLAAKLDA